MPIAPITAPINVVVISSMVTWAKLYQGGNVSVMKPNSSPKTPPIMTPIIGKRDGLVGLDMMAIILGLVLAVLEVLALA